LSRPAPHVIVVGGGVTGLSAALALARRHVGVTLVENSRFLGGHAAQLSCKAVDRCVSCGACLVEERLREATHHPGIRILTETRLLSLRRESRFRATFERTPSEENAEKSTRPDRADARIDCEADALLVATGFSPFDPSEKPYGYTVFEDVMTHLELDRTLRSRGIALRPSDAKRPGSIAFIQCVGSRDEKIDHLWCSRVCCGAALRMAGRIKGVSPDTDITFFYIDIQRFGKDFPETYRRIRSEFRMIRAIPGDVARTEEGRLRVSFFDPERRAPDERDFDLLVLSVGMTPNRDQGELSAILRDAPASGSRFFDADPDSSSGIFFAGAATGPLGIAESVASGERAARRASEWVEGTR
jgi:heterodisulfide reductase subunit A2